MLFSPINFVSRYSELDKFIDEFNQYLAFDSWKVVRIGKEITFSKADQINFEDKKTNVSSEKDFLEREFDNINISEIGLEDNLTALLDSRIKEASACFKSKANLATICICGSVLEGVLLGIASRHPRSFNQAQSSPKDKLGKAKAFHEWKFAELIEVGFELGYLQLDVKKFSHSLRDFRNYIHAHSQLMSGFVPSDHTAKICFQVLKAAIYEITKKEKNEKIA